MNADKKKKIIGSQSRWVIGVDLGQRRDYSAVAAVEVFDAVYDQRDPVTGPRSRWGELPRAA